MRAVAILFDIDGTLISTGGAGARSWRWAFERLFGIPADIDSSSEAGMTDPEVARSTFRAVMRRRPRRDEIARLMAAYLDRLPIEVETSTGYRVLDGVAELLPRLRRDGFLLGITTGALEAAAHVKLARGNLNTFFSFGGYGSDSSDRAALTGRAIERAGAILGRSVDPGVVVVVGDTPLDVAAARAVGATSIAVASGRYARDELERSGADHVLASLREPFPITADGRGPRPRP